MSNIKTAHRISQVETKKTKTGWRVRMFHRNYGNNTPVKMFQVYTPEMEEQHAVRWANYTKQGERCRTASRGDWVLSNLKKKYSLDERKELFVNWNRYLRAEFGELRESRDTQNEIIRVLKLPQCYAMSGF